MPVSIKGSGGGSVTLDAGAAAADSTLTLPNTSGTILQSGTAVTAAQGGTGLTSPGTAGNVLTSNGTTWTSAAPSSGTGPAFAASNSGSQTFSGGTWTKITFPTELFDTNNCFDNVTNYRFTPTVAGYYQINVALSANEAGAGGVSLLCAVYKNGTIYSQAINRDDNGQSRNLSNSCVVSLNGTTDYVEIYGYSSGGTFSVNQLRTFSGALVRTA